VKKSLSKKTILIGSGKGGVGKSTVAVNLAVALAKRGLSIGLLDADLYGPSIPIMTGLRRMSPQSCIDSNGVEKIYPIVKFGVKLISIGFFIEEARSITWRGPLLHGTLQKFVDMIDWGDLDYLLIDLPPGTGDIQISLSQMLEVNAAIVVTTPQEVAMLDAIKAINAFDQLNIPVLGVVENMSGFTVPDTDQIFHIFGKGKASELARRFETDLLETIPILPSIRVGGDEGCPVAFHDDEKHNGRYFHSLAQMVIQKTEVNTINPFL
jgi:ATP-binding protein involved in chromosome partitioning